MTAMLDTNKVSLEFGEYMQDYFNKTVLSGTYWAEAIVSASGISQMTTDLVMMAEGLSHNLNIADTYTVYSGTALDVEGIPPDTDTDSLYTSLLIWKNRQNTIYADVLYGKLMAMLVRQEPVVKLKTWFNLDQNSADVLWNLLNTYKTETNLESAFLEAVKIFNDGRVFTRDDIVTSATTNTLLAQILGETT